MDKTGRQMENSIHNVEKVVWTNYNILWTHKFSSDISNNDKQDPSRLN